MQRTVLILAYFFICTNLVAQQYPFVHYTPKDGLISNMIKGIYQDSKGRLYFTSLQGLSVYDGSRFVNYNAKNGLNYDLVNYIMEMGDDSVWVVTNSTKVNCLVNGKMKVLPFKNHNFVINNLCQDAKGRIYAVAEEGLLLFNNKDQFIKLPFINHNGENVSSYLSVVLSFDDYLLVQRDNSMLPKQDNILYLYNKTSQMIIAEIPGIYAMQVAKDHRIWLSTEKEIVSVDTVELKKGKLVLQELPPRYVQLRNKGKYFILSDDGNNLWLGDQSNILIKVANDGTITSFTSASGLNMFFINSIFQDREGITWIATNNTGVTKLVHSNFSHIENPFGITNPTDISYNENTENMLVYSFPAYAIAVIHNNDKKYFHINNALTFTRIVETRYGFFAIDRNTVYRLKQIANNLYPEAILSDSSGNIYPNLNIDKNGNLIIPGKYHLTAVINGKTISKVKLPFFADIPVVDSKGNIWAATRASDLLMYQVHPEDPSNYLKQEFHFKKELSGFSPRSMAIDKDDNIWIGTRNHGIQVFYVQNNDLVKRFSINTAAGLSDEFTTQLACDAENNIWACSALGLDKITIKNGKPVVENITKQNNIYQSVFKIIIDKNNNAWGLVSNGLIRIIPEKMIAPDYSPKLMISLLKAGKDTITKTASLSHNQNNLSFNFSATSFFNEKQIMYSYRLQGGTNEQWSEPSNNSTVSFVDLPPGDYSLDIKADFPAARYPEKILNYRFSITPAWWQTWWFRSITFLATIALLISAFRFYYRRKLEQRLAAFERQQAIEKERTRIATDMHDDLGAGLSRIKFLSETIGIKKQQQQPIEEDVNKIREYSHEMIDKMGEIVWALNEKNDSLSDLLSYTRAYAVEYLSQNGIKCFTDIPDQFPQIFVSGEFRRNIYLTIKEALHNIVKHAQASEVRIKINVDHNNLNICIKDNGMGFDKNSIRAFSNGLSNMELRIKETGGQFEIKSEKGTDIKIKAPLPS